jgi:hypothetical protein
MRSCNAVVVGKRLMFSQTFPRLSDQAVNSPGERGGVSPARGQREGGEGWEPERAVTRASLIDRQERGGSF